MISKKYTYFVSNMSLYEYTQLVYSLLIYIWVVTSF